MLRQPAKRRTIAAAAARRGSGRRPQVPVRAAAPVGPADALGDDSHAPGSASLRANSRLAMTVPVAPAPTITTSNSRLIASGHPACQFWNTAARRPCSRGQRRLRGRQQVERQEPKVAQMLHRCQRSGEHPHQRIGERDEAASIRRRASHRTPPAALHRPESPAHARGRSAINSEKACHIAQPEIETHAGDRMQPLSRIADDRAARGAGTLRSRQ